MSVVLHPGGQPMRILSYEDVEAAYTPAAAAAVVVYRFH